MDSQVSVLQKMRLQYQPKLPKALRGGDISVQLGMPTESIADQTEISRLFPHTYGQPEAKIVEGPGDLKTEALKLGVVLSGGQAPGGHNVIAGLFDALKAANKESKLFGFLKGPCGVIKGRHKEITATIVDKYRNTGGFDMIMSGRDKIETAEQLAACKQENFEDMDLDGLVIIGGDDSNTNAAMLAEYLKKEGSKTVVIGVPKTIDGDMKNEQIEASFGFDTACKTYSELIGNICRDATSAVKYWHFIRLMGRAASHVALECALQTHVNVCLVSEEVQAKGTTLDQIVEQIAAVINQRSEAGKNYGIVVVPEGLPEFISDIKTMIDELSNILGKDEKYIHEQLEDHSERVQYLSQQLSDHSARVYGSLPKDIQDVLLHRDDHGNVPLSQVETERLLIDLVSDKLRFQKTHGESKAKFSPLAHFFGYEGRCAAPSNIDADYCYSLGYTAAQLVRARLTGYTCNVQNLTKPADEWVAGATPVTMMLNMETRKGESVPVIKKALVELEGTPFKRFAEHRENWALNDCYVFPGPIQYLGPSEVCDAPTITLALEKE